MAASDPPSTTPCFQELVPRVERRRSRPLRTNLASRTFSRSLEGLDEALALLAVQRDSWQNAIGTLSTRGAPPEWETAAKVELRLTEEAIAKLLKRVPWDALNRFKIRVSDLLLANAVDAVTAMLTDFKAAHADDVDFKKAVRAPSNADTQRIEAFVTTFAFASKRYAPDDALLDAIESAPSDPNVLGRLANLRKLRLEELTSALTSREVTQILYGGTDVGSGPRRAAEAVVADVAGVSPSTVREAVKSRLKQRSVSTRR